MSRSTRPRPPYRAGDAIRLLYLDPRYGTCLGTTRVERIHEALENGKWTITYRHPLGNMTTSTVNARGADRHGYIEKVPA